MTKRIKKRNIALSIFIILAFLYLFLVSIQVMGSSFKMMGSDFAETLISATSNPFIALFIGILATTVVQSSSVTTSLVVGLTAGGALTLGGAIPMIMGANIGTSVTNTIVSLAHISEKGEFKNAFKAATIHDFFNFFAVIIMFPLELIFHPLEKMATSIVPYLGAATVDASFNSPLKAITKPAANVIIDLIGSPIILVFLSFILIIVSLRGFVTTIKPYAKAEFKHFIGKKVFGSVPRSLGLGFVLTAIVQSSSVTTSLAVPLTALGLISLESLLPYIIGANIGTTITSLLAALGTGSTAALTVAVCHVLFNVIGALLVLPFRHYVFKITIGASEIATKHRYAAILYVALVFYLIPLALIWVLL